MATSHYLVVFALLVLCFVAPSTQKFTLHVDEVYPNFGPTTEILELSTGSLDTAELDVSTLRVQSEDGVTITTPGGITLDGASFSSNAGNVSLTTTDSNSEINIIGANALDFFGSTVDFSSENGYIELHAEADFQFIGKGTFDAQVNNFNSIGDNIVVSATAGALTFAMTGDFNAGGSLFNADGINGLSVIAAETVTLESVFNNLDVNGNTVALSANTVAVNADRNNIVLAAASTLSGSFDDIAITGDDGVYIVSMESDFHTTGDDVLLEATNGDFSSVALFETYFEGGDATFTSNTDGTRFVASSGMIGKLSDSITLAANDDVSMTSLESFSAHSSQGIVTLTANGVLTMAGTEASYGSIGTTAIDATDRLGLDAVAGLYVTAAQSIVYGSQLPVTSTFPIDVTAEDTRLGGATVSATVNSLTLTGSSEDRLVFRTSDLSRDSILQMVADNAVSITAASFEVEGGLVTLQASRSLSVQLNSSDLGITTGFESFGSQLAVTAGADISINSGSDGIDIDSRGDMLHSATTSISMDSTDSDFDAERNAIVRAGTTYDDTTGSIAIVAQDNFDVTTRSGSIGFDVTSADAAFTSRGVLIARAENDIVMEVSSVAADSRILNVHGEDVELSTSTDVTATSTDGIIAFAGDNDLNVDVDAEIGANFVFFGSPPGQDITFNADDIDVGGESIGVVGNNVEISATDFSITASDIGVFSGSQKPITITSTTLTVTTDDADFLPADDISIISPSLTLALDDASLTANFDIDVNVDSDYLATVAVNTFYDAADISFATEGTHTSTSQVDSTYVADTMSIVSTAGNIATTVGGSFLFDASVGGFNPTTESMTATNTVRFAAILDILAQGNSDWLHFSDQLVFNSVADTTINSQNDITFLGTTIDHTANTLTTDSDSDMNIFGRDVEINADLTMDYTIFGGDILIDGDSVFLSQVGTGAVTNNVNGDAEFIGNGRLVFLAGGDWSLTSSLAANPPTERAVILTTSARSAGISVASQNANFEADGSISFLATDYATGEPGTFGGIGTNSGGFDVNLLANGVSTFTSDFVNTPTSGVRMLSEGAAYDEKLGINTGALFRILSASNMVLSSEDRGVNLVGGDNVSFEAEVGNVFVVTNDDTQTNTVTSSLGDIEYDNLGGSIVFRAATSGDGLVTAQGYGTMQSGVGGQSLVADETATFVVAGDFDIQADGGNVIISQADTSITVDSFNVLIEGADNFDWSADALTATSTGVATNCLGGNTVSADCNDLSIFGDTGANFEAEPVSITAGTELLIQSSLNNDVTFELEQTDIIATAAVSISGGVNTEFAGFEVFDVVANDILFTSQGSHFISSAGETIFSSVAPQLYQAGHSIVVEASDITVGDAISPVANIYAGGLGRPYGIEINAEDDIVIESDEDVSVAANSVRALSSTATTIEAGAAATLHSLGTPNIGNDIFFDSAEDITVDASTQALMTASNILIEFDTDLLFEGDATITSQRAITTTSERTTSFDGDVNISADDVSFVSFLRDPVDAVSGDSTSATGNLQAQVWTATGDLTINSEEDMTWEADGILSLLGTNDVILETANSNSDISFETLGKLSDIVVSAAGNLDSASTRVDFISVHSSTFGSSGPITVDAGDSLTSVAQGDTIFTSGLATQFVAAGDIEFTSTGRLLVNTDGTGTNTFTGSEVFIDADKDVVFELPHRASGVGSHIVDIDFQDEIDMLYGADFRYRVGGDVQFNAGVMGISVNGVFQDNDDGLTAGDETFGFRMTASSFSDVDGSPTGTITLSSDTGASTYLAQVDFNMDAAGNSNFNAASTHIEAHGPDGLTLSASESDTDVVLLSDNDFSIVADELVTFHAFGDETGTGTMEFYVEGGQAGPLNLGYDFVQIPTVSIGIVSDQGDVTFNAEQGRISHEVVNFFNTGPYGSGQNNTASYYMNPGVNGTLSMSAYGSDEDGIGFFASAAGTYLVSEHNIVLKGDNVRFEELGQDPYSLPVYPLTYNADFYDLQQTRAVVYGYTEQDWTAGGANENGNGIEVISSVPFEGIAIESYFVGFSAGGSVRVEAAEELSFFAEHGFDAESESSIIIEAHAAANDDIGILIASLGFVNGNTLEVGHVQFHAEQDLLLDAAGQLLVDSDTTLRFTAGPQSTTTFNGDSGFYVNTDSSTMTAGGRMTFQAAQDIYVQSASALELTATSNININGNNAVDDTSDVVFGNPDLDSGTLSYYGGVNTLSGNILLDSNLITINAAVFDITQTAALVLPEEINFTGCGSLLPGSTFMLYNGNVANLAHCNAETGQLSQYSFNTVN